MKDTVKKPPRAGMGRPKGATNKATKELKDMILQALDEAGGVTYLVEQAKINGGAFMGLIGKILPKDINANLNGKITLEDLIAGSK